MENFYQIYFCDKTRFRVFLNLSNSDVVKYFNIINRNETLTRKFAIVIEAVKNNVATRLQFNWESKCEYGDIYAIKVDQHRFYTIVLKNNGYRELYICRYGKKESEQNDKSLTTTINSISKITLNIPLQ